MGYTNAQKQMNALEEEAVKALTGESQLDLSVVNTMIIKHLARRDAAEQAIEEARERLEQEQNYEQGDTGPNRRNQCA